MIGVYCLDCSRVQHLKSALHNSELSSRNEPMIEFTTATLPDGLGPIDVGIPLPDLFRDDSKGNYCIYEYTNSPVSLTCYFLCYNNQFLLR